MLRGKLRDEEVRLGNAMPSAVWGTYEHTVYDRFYSPFITIPDLRSPARHQSCCFISIHHAASAKALILTTMPMPMQMHSYTHAARRILQRLEVDRMKCSPSLLLVLLLRQRISDILDPCTQP